MEVVSLLTGVLVTTFAVCVFGGKEDVQDNILANELELTGRLVTLSCQTCRKLKRHKELEPNLFECTKCRRHIDLRE